MQKIIIIAMILTFTFPFYLKAEDIDKAFNIQEFQENYQFLGKEGLMLLMSESSIKYELKTGNNNLALDIAKNNNDMFEGNPYLYIYI